MMTQSEHHAICAVIKALSVKRNRFGRIEIDRAAQYDLHELVRRTPGIPHGGEDTVDQAVMVLQSLVGQKPTSIMDA